MAAQSRGGFKYLISEDSIESRIIPGKFGFIASFNEKRGSLRRKPQEVIDLKMAFNHNIFNFTKLSENEILFDIEIFYQDAKRDANSGMEDSAHTLQSTIVINNSPIEFGSSLIVPSLKSCQNQVITLDSIRIGLIVALLSDDPSIRLGFNSLGACASVNHLHFHVYYLKHKLCIEDQPFDERNVLIGWPLAGFVFEIDESSPNLIRDLVNVSNQVFKIAKICLDMNQPHNIFITRSHTRHSVVRIIIWPRSAIFGSKNDMELAVAFCEFSGFFICKTRNDYDTISENDCIKLMASLDAKIDEILLLLNKV